MNIIYNDSTVRETLYCTTGTRIIRIRRFRTPQTMRKVFDGKSPETKKKTDKNRFGYKIIACQDSL